MFQTPRRATRTRSALGMAELIYHTTVRNVRKNHRNPLVALLLNMLQTLVLVISFYFMFSILGLRNNAVRGDYLLYIMSGIFLYVSHSKALQAVLQSDGPTSQMMKHAPMNTVVSVCSAALGTLYIQLLSLFIVLFLYHCIVHPVVIDQPVAALGTVILAWFSGAAIGTVFLAIKPWAPEVVQIVAQVYSRANMIASGKMFLANTLPAYMLSMFDWNPLFHCIDQARGFTFLHYNPHFSSLTYPIAVSVVLLMIGMLGESYTRRHASISWNAAR